MYTIVLDSWIKEFEDLSVEFCGDKYCEVKSLIARLHLVMNQIPLVAREKMFLLFSYEGNILISEDDFRIVTASWAVFVATDVNHDNELDTHELKTMLWLVEGKEPDASRVASAMYTMDADKQGTISILEWIQFLVCPGSEDDGGNYFDYELRKKFDQFDTSHDGKIGFSEFVQFLKNEFKTLKVEVPLKE